MGSYCDYLENKILDHVLGGGDFTRPATVYIGLSTTTIADDGTGITEPSGNGYARIAVTNNGTNFPAASGGAKVNGAEFSFAEATGAWGTCSDYFAADASVGGNILFAGLILYGENPTPKVIGAGDTAKFPAGTLSFSQT